MSASVCVCLCVCSPCLRYLLSLLGVCMGGEDGTAGFSVCLSAMLQDSRQCLALRAGLRR